MVKNVALLLAGLLAGVAIMVAGHWPQTEVVYRSEQPPSVTYDDGSTHHLGLIRRGSVFGDATHLLVVGRDPGLGYGHWVNVHTPFLAPGKEVEETEWTAEGVRVRFAGGHELFVPARHFQNGR
ncbi:hypothetical protein [Nonomuraea sp. NPDC048826]|uniref:hypothetical protein n=1 Tax=Nonomuraea sp. NPDC048826 TaxID=3364347 RepID=UPI00371BB665